MDIVNLFMIAVLIALTAFFVAAEFAIVKVRSSRIDQLVAEKKRGAVAAKKVTTSLDEYLSACQLGITVTALGLGFKGEPTFKHLIQPVVEFLGLNGTIATTISFILAFSFMTFIHVVIGELAPKTLAIQKAESLTLILSTPLIVFYKIAYPFIWVLNGSARFFTGLFGIKPASESEEVHTEEELRIILSESFESGEINQAEYNYLNNIFEFDNRLAKEIMVPRTEIIGLYAEDPIEEQIEIIKNEKYTRYPVFGEDKDDILGMVNVKDFFIRYLDGEVEKSYDFANYTRPVIQVIETIAIHDLLLLMQKKRIPLAILYDEYGGTAGLLTMEDILEEIVGEIRDEYDDDEKPAVQHISDSHKIVDGKVLITEINDLFGLYVVEDDVDTIGGWILTQNHDIQQGESIIFEDFEFKVVELDSHQVKLVEIKKNEFIEAAK
ncbi:HlyC/CorC family transporter [Arthrobacter citreus]|nr:HlyC/CorC family transporter [Arthrobacter citreus]